MSLSRLHTISDSNKSDKKNNSNDSVILNGGILFSVKYIGCIEINTSMKILDFQTRSLVAKECINRVLEAANVKTPKKRRVDKRIQQSIANKPCMEHAGTNVILNISSRCLEIASHETKEIIAKHDMPRISFASGGDADALDFVAYVAKDVMEWRACYVLECGGGIAQNLISTMGQAFELRYNEFYVNSIIKRNPNHDNNNTKCETDYYNDLPGKMAPDFTDDCKQSNVLPRDRLPSNLIDLSSNIEHDYVNDEKHNNSDNNLSHISALHCNNNNHSGGAVGGIRDVFDMQSFSLSADVQKSQLMIENWYHGPITRQVAENLLKCDGEFLVRESNGSPGQYVLTGMKSAQPKHLLLIDPEGVVRTKDRVFESISHLVNYHWTNSLPIISSESALLLRTPLNRTTDLRN
ncbi:unnamed protein product [Diamesa hyperborea]